MRTLKLVIEYDGTGLCGWQSQAGRRDQPTVQEALEAALSRVLDEPVRVDGAGRTDAGVHARGQVARIRTENPLPEGKVLRGANTYLPRGIAVREIREVPEDFDPRGDALRRHYRYLVWCSVTPSPLRARWATWVRGRVRSHAMAEAARLFEGKHDFSAFRSSHCTAKNPRRTMNLSRMRRRGSLLVFDFVSRAFLHSQVRIMVGTLLEVGKGKRAPEMITEALASGDRTDAGATAPPEGLTLWSITYPSGL
jgi:tRNA pseudouridine38-40 synthase